MSDLVGRATINDAGGRSGGDQRRGGEGLELGGVEDSVDPEKDRQLELVDDRVDPMGDAVWSDVA